MDLKDRRILSCVDLHARLPHSTIGSAVALSKETAGNRLKTLERRGIIGGYATIINMARLGYTGYAVFSRLEGANPAEKDRILEMLIDHPAVYWVAAVGGNYDVLFAIRARNILEFDQIHAELQSRAAPFLKSEKISIRIQVSQFPRHYLLESKPELHAPYFGREFADANVDATDRCILNELSEDARISVTDLAQKLSIPRTTVGQRIRRLEGSGIIQGYSSLIHAEKYGYQIFQIFLYLTSLDDNMRHELAAYCANHPNIVFYADTVGSWQCEITCEVADQLELQTLLTDLRSRFSQAITGIELAITFNYYLKYRIHV